MADGPNNSSNSGFYSPDEKPFNFSSNYQEMINRTDGILSASILDGIDNLINMMPNYYGEQLSIAGEDTLWLRRKTAGTPCPNMAYGDTEDQCPVAKCPICYGTTWVGGYDPAVRLKVSFNPQKVDIKIGQAGLGVEENPDGWTIDTDPVIKAFDLLVSYNNIRHIVTDAKTEEKRGKRMYQRLNLTRLDVYDVAYSVPVPSFYGSYNADFKAVITIHGPHTDFQAVITIDNEYWYPVTGRNDYYEPQLTTQGA